jgi:hypothetical protein
MKEEAMQDREERKADTRMRDTGLMPAGSLGQTAIEPIEEAPPAYVKEPLLNKKVMFAWALGAFAVWFAVQMIVPIITETARTTIREAAQEVETGTDGTITIRRNGKVISITRGPNPTVRVDQAVEATPPATTAPPLEPAPVAPPAKAPATKR